MAEPTAEEYLKKIASNTGWTETVLRDVLEAVKALTAQQEKFQKGLIDRLEALEGRLVNRG